MRPSVETVSAPSETNLPKKFIEKEEPVVQALPAPKPQVVVVPVVEEIKTEIIPETKAEEKVVEEVKVPLLIEVKDDYASRPNISGTIQRKGDKTSGKSTNTSTTIPLLRPLTGEVSIEGTVKRK